MPAFKGVDSREGYVVKRIIGTNRGPRRRHSPLELHETLRRLPQFRPRGLAPALACRWNYGKRGNVPLGSNRTLASSG